MQRGQRVAGVSKHEKHTAGAGERAGRVRRGKGWLLGRRTGEGEASSRGGRRGREGMGARQKARRLISGHGWQNPSKSHKCVHSSPLLT